MLGRRGAEKYCKTVCLISRVTLRYVIGISRETTYCTLLRKVFVPGSLIGAARVESVC